ncbi:MAG: hypothetical protein HYR66_15955 [Sphingobacteriales bacterium]|nr:hypothetical protein [Sphingobacteriales bacterium]MBI3717162.1 hypothetical protein [Sphingobacteriales bacterium]
MPVNKKYISDFLPNRYIHIIGKAAGNTQLFMNDDNRTYFLKKYAAYSNGYFDTYAYTLLDNHVHFLVKCTDDVLLREHLKTFQPDMLKTHQKKYLYEEINFSEACEFQFKDFFIAYAMAYNKMFNRRGALFINPFRRILVEDESHFTMLIIYIHANVLKHGVRKDFMNYNWSSFKAFLSGKSTLLKREEVLDWFGGTEQFMKVHQELSKYYYEHIYAME